MPFFFIDKAIVYFAHVPKAAGSAVEDYLADRYGDVFLLNRLWASIRRDHPELGRVSPQHLTFEAARQYMPRDPDWTFAVVRNPYDRIFSEYRMHQGARRRRKHLAKLGQEFHVNLLLCLARLDPLAFDNHLRPQSALIPEDAAVFKMEEGVEKALIALNDRFGQETGKIELGSRYTHKQDQVLPSQRLVDRISRAYDDDFRRFDYPKDCACRATRFSDILSGLLAAVAARFVVTIERRGLL